MRIKALQLPSHSAFRKSQVGNKRPEREFRVIVETVRRTMEAGS